MKSRLSSDKIKRGDIKAPDDLYGGLDYYIEGSLSQIADNRNIHVMVIINKKNQR